jgi:hypothetical protein
MSSEARRLLWWPFTQHANISNDLVTVIDSRCGDDFAVFQPPRAVAGGALSGTIQAQFDACASWWTQVCYPPSPHTPHPPTHTHTHTHTRGGGVGAQAAAAKCFRRFAHDRTVVISLYAWMSAESFWKLTGDLNQNDKTGSPLYQVLFIWQAIIMNEEVGCNFNVDIMSFTYMLGNRLCYHSGSVCWIPIEYASYRYSLSHSRAHV